MNRIKVIVFLSVIALTVSIMPDSIFADQLPKDAQPMLSSLKGNLVYYVAPGDKVKKGDPLFLVLTPDNNPAIFFQIVHKIHYYAKIYQRRKDLIKTHAVSEEELDNTLNNLILSKDELVSYITSFKQGFYVAPYDCEVVSIAFPNGSGIKDGFTALNIKPVDADYKFEPRKPNDKLMEILKSANELTKEQVDSLDVNAIVAILQKAK